MKHLLNTLYVTTEGSYLARQGVTLCVRRERQTVARYPIHALEQVVCFGRVGCSPRLLELAGRQGVTVSFLSPTGRFWARVIGPTSGNVLLRRRQYRVADDPAHAMEIARSVVTGKIANCRQVLLRGARDYPDADGKGSLRQAAKDMHETLRSLQTSSTLDVVRGYEGEAAARYFAVFDHLIVTLKDDFAFRKRSRRPPLDPVNALLSFLYVLLLQDAVAALEAVGLDPAVGYLHRDRPGRPGLALDLMEELRPLLADRLAVSLINRRQVKRTGFQTTETGAVAMDDRTRKEVLVAYQTRKRDEIQHPYLDEKVVLGLLPHTQALLMARHLRGDLEAYPPFLWR